MNKLALTYLIGGAVVIGGIVFFAMTSKSLTNEISPIPTEEGSSTFNEVSTSSEKRSMRDLLALGNPQKCTVNSSNDFSESAGTVYVANGKMRGDFESLTQGVTVQSHMIADGEYSYIWTSANNQGFKTKIDAVESSASGTNQQGIDYNQQMDYACSGWSVDASLFVLPNGITFTDLGQMMQNLPSSI